MEGSNYRTLFSTGNMVLYFQGEPASTTPRTYREITIPRLHSRGVFWEPVSLRADTLSTMRRIVSVTERGLSA